MTHFWHRWYRSMTALALFAMLMAFTGPLISQLQRLMEMPVGATAPMSQHGGAMPHAQGEPQTVDGSHIVNHFELAACGYCELFLHAPGIEAPSVVPPISPTPAVFYPPSNASVPASAPIYPRYASRAPPRV